MRLQLRDRFVGQQTCAVLSCQLELYGDAALGPNESALWFEIADGAIQHRSELREALANRCSRQYLVFHPISAGQRDGLMGKVVDVLWIVSGA